MATTTILVPMAALMKDLTLEVNLTGLRANKFRVWLGMKFIKLGARVIGCGFRVEKDT